MALKSTDGTIRKKRGDPVETAQRNIFTPRFVDF